MTQENMNHEEEIFARALECDSTPQLHGYLEEACGGDVELRRRIEALLRRHQDTQGPLESPLLGPQERAEFRPIAERPGTFIGRYKLLEQIGEGGFGVVFMAEQQQPVRRKVALKIIKPGMDTREVIARFEAERQALAIMDHPNIAKVLDAGATESGRPYFVMELVRGIPITSYCDQASSTAQERLELFATVCQAVQHAHQKGIIHRDIKPSNVLVTLRDDRPIPKVIDFGVAKATNQRLTEKTLFTRFAQIIGTPLYMSPEQAGMSELDVDTRSDIYSLGVLLYELLTGTTPVDQQRFRDAAHDELLRIIREEDPPRPSMRISTLGDALPSVAAQRKIEPRKLSSLFRGELDWIVMKALEKERTRRYETANEFGRDIERYLADEPVLACPPSAGYRFRKLARRHKTAIATGMLVSLALLGGLCGTTWQAIRATQQRDRARNAEVAAKAETEARQMAEVSQMYAVQALHEATNRLELAQLERDKAQESEMMARDAHKRALEAKQQAEANNQEAERQRKLAERSEHIARKAEEMALAAQNDAVEAAARSQGAEDVVAELVRSMFVNAHHLSDVEQNLDARYALHWAMAALAQITNSRDERISNLDECIRLAEQRVGLLEAEFPDSGSGPDIKVIGELSIARSRLLRAKRELANLADRQTRQAALKANVLNHLEWWRRVHTYAITGRRGGETYHEDEAARRLYLAMSEAVAEGIELEELDTDGLFTDDIKAARPDRQELLELAVAAGESVCKANQLRWDRAIHRRGREGKVDEAWAAAIPEIMEGLAELARARIALAQLIKNPDGHRAGLESQAAVLQEYIEGLVQLASSEADALTRAAIDFVKSHHALVELQLMRFGTTRSFP